MPILKDDNDIKRALQDCKNIAVVGISREPYKPSYFVADVLQGFGFKIYLVNPNYQGQEILGQKVYSTIKEIPVEIDIVDVFRKPSAMPEVAREAKEKGFKTFWMQPGTQNMDVAKELDKAGYNVVAGKCAKVESMRLL
jgi:uncharacterized protein